MMGMTITEKILADHAGKKAVHLGELVDCTLDVPLLHAPLPPFAQEIMAAGGFMEYVAKKKGLVGRPA